ncbi:MAG: zf-HC2 domain-containing protein [Clostridia bacterium]|nr:zf-HC2 domain-containing protein [Clostridia bacterium]
MYPKNTETDCQHCQDLLFDYVSHLTEDSQAKQIQTHLAHCPSCKKEYDEIRAMLSVMENAPEPELPEGFQLSLHQKLVQTAEEMEQQKAHSLAGWLHRMKNYGIWQVAAPALVCLALVIGVFSSGLYDQWRNADQVLTGEVPPQPTASSNIEATPQPELQSDTDADQQKKPVASPQPKSTVAFSSAESTTAPAMPEDTKEDIGNAQADSSNIPEAAAAEPEVITADTEAAMAMIEDAPAAYTGRISENSTNATMTDAVPEACSEDAAADTHTGTVSGGGSSSSAMPGGSSVAASATYRVSLSQSVTAFLKDCQSATGINWSAKATTLSKTYAVLNLSASEWEILSQYITSTGVVPRLVSGDKESGVTVVIQGYED